MGFLPELKHDAKTTVNPTSEKVTKRKLFMFYLIYCCFAMQKSRQTHSY